MFEYLCILLTVACLYSHIIRSSSSSTRFKFTPSTQANNTHELTKPFPICCTLAHTKCDNLDERGKHNCTFALHQVCIFIPSATAPAVMEKDVSVRTHEHWRHMFIFIHVLSRWSSPPPPSGNHGAQMVFSRWRLHNEHTTSPSSTPSLNAWEQHSSQVLFLHAYHCCCHSCGCLSLAFCVLKLLIYSSFLPGTLHLICDERTGAGDKMFQYYRCIKRNVFFFV